MVAKENKQDGPKYLFADWYGSEEKKWYGEVWEFGHVPVYCHNEATPNSRLNCTDPAKVEKVIL